MNDASPEPQSLVEMLAASVARCASRTLFLTKRDGHWVETSYAVFGRIVDHVRGGLAALGVGPGDHVGIISGNRIEWAAIAYASYQLGAALVPMYESQLETDWAFIVRDAGIKVLFASNLAIYRKVAELRRSTPTLRHLVLLDGVEAGAEDGVEMTYAQLVWRGQCAPAPVHAPAAGDVACLMYTSGTTGQPKGVVLSHRNILSNILTLKNLLPLAEGHRTLCFLPWAHAFGHTVELHGVVAGGASMALAESVDKIVDNLVEVRPTVLVAVPRVFMRVYTEVEKGLAAKPGFIRRLAQQGLQVARKRTAGAPLTLRERALWRVADGLILSKIRSHLGGRLEYAISGAAALPLEVAEFIDGLGIAVYEGYGLTETSPVVSANIPGQRKLGSVGRPLPGVRVVIDPTPTATADARQGEIVVFGPNVMRGYHGRADETRDVLGEDGALRTGDIGYLDEDGFLFITGRIKEQYKLANGKYVSPAPLEECLKLSPFIADVMVYGDNREHNVALVVPDPETMQAWAVGAGLRDQYPGALLRHPRVLERVHEEIEKLSGGFRHYERIVALALLPEAFTQESGMLTPSLKLKRRNIIARWRDEIERLYRGQEKPRTVTTAEGSSTGPRAS